MMTPATKIPIQDWMSDPATQAVLAPLVGSDAADPTILFVGGCVRDALLERPVVDVDMATVFPPEEVMRRLDAAGIGYHIPGVAHGTVAAHVDGRVFEITTLRVDVETDGRHAQVAYTDDWALDASRRDFTINALFADADGNVFDPLGGMADIEARQVRFIGDANERIREDALRILRFFRFNAQLDTEAMDSRGLAACRASAEMLGGLSGERIRDEVFKLLRAPGVKWRLNDDAFPELFGWVLPELPNLKGCHGLDGIAVIEEEECEYPDALRRLASLIEAYPLRALEDLPNWKSDVVAIAGRLRLSGDQKKRLLKMLDRPRELGPRWEQASTFNWDHASALLPVGRMQTLQHRFAKEKKVDRSYRPYLYELDDEAWRDAVLLNWSYREARIYAAAQSDAPAQLDPPQQWRDLLELPGRLPRPEFPLRGADVLKIGIQQGPDISRLLNEIETWWIAGGFEAGRRKCLKELKQRAKRTSN